MSRLKSFLNNTEIVITGHNHSCKKKDCYYCQKLTSQKQSSIKSLIKILNLPNTYLK